MDKDTIRHKIREQLDAGTLPREVPPLTKGGAWHRSAPPAHISADSAIGVARCSGCGSGGAQVTYLYADGSIFRFHSRCHRIWEEECRRPTPAEERVSPR
jgi:hypothetical protein